MMKKNILAVALLSSALVIGTGAALAHGMRGATEVKAATNKTFGFVNKGDWGALKAYAWKDAPEVTVKNADWPGVAVETKADFKIADKDVFTITLDTDIYDRLIFNNGSGTQTGDLNIGSLPTQSIYVWGDGMTSPHTWGVVGNIGGVDHWGADVATGNSVPWTQTNATITVALNAGDTFKIRADSAWAVELNGEDISGRNATYFEDADPDNDGSNALVKEGKSGTYTFEINWGVEAYGDKTYGVSVTNFVPSSTSYKMRGNGSLWEGDFVAEEGLAMTVVSATEVKIEDVTLAAGDKFKFTDGTNWYGFSNIKTGSPLYAFLEADVSDNIVVKTGKGGVFTFYVDINIDPEADTSENPEADKAIWVTNDDYVALDTWARGFMVNEDLCNGTGHEWSEYATSYAALDASVRALFAANKTDAKADGASYIEKAAYRYEYGVAVKGQTAFAEAQRPYDGFKDKYSTALGLFHVEQKTNVTAIVVATVSLGAIAAAAGFVFLRKKRNNA